MSLGNDYSGTPDDAVAFTAMVARMMRRSEIGESDDREARDRAYRLDSETLDRLIEQAREVERRETEEA